MPHPCQLIVRKADLFTANQNDDLHGTLAVNDGRFAELGTDADIAELWQGKTSIDAESAVRQMIWRGGAKPAKGGLVRRICAVGIGTEIARATNLEIMGSVSLAASKVAKSPMTAQDVFRARTIDAARTLGAERYSGTLEIGKYAA
ncbi:amidohydrolase family protein [Mesorhizobium caraganae]|uniref:amidohydrolase family protein n=1 Tax=Mesorhizobium caraganae TaxID=483206 RepID=UPI00177F16F9|nr:amidohydrolase family protein [Mesorhizobium caraganae]